MRKGPARAAQLINYTFAFIGPTKSLCVLGLARGGHARRVMQALQRQACIPGDAPHEEPKAHGPLYASWPLAAMSASTRLSAASSSSDLLCRAPSTPPCARLPLGWLCKHGTCKCRNSRTLRRAHARHAHCALLMLCLALLGQNGRASRLAPEVQECKHRALMWPSQPPCNTPTCYRASTGSTPHPPAAAPHALNLPCEHAPAPAQVD